MNNPKELLDSLHVTSRALVDAEEAVATAQTKLRALMSQVQENMRMGAAPAQETSSVNNLAEPITPVTQTQPIVRFHGAENIPQSAASRIDPSEIQLPTSLRSSPTREVSPGPTLESQKKELTPEERFAEQLGHFVGTGSLFARYLSPTVVPGGKGFLKPGVAGLEQYSDDAVRVTPQGLEAWPTSFYRTQITRAPQFLLQTPFATVLLTPQPESGGPLAVFVALRPLSPQSTLRPLSEIALTDLLLLKEAVEFELKALSAKVA